MLTAILAKISEKIPEELKVIWRQIENKRLFYFAAALSLFAAAVNAVTPYIYGTLMDYAVSFSRPWGVILVLLLLWFLLSFSRDLASAFSQKIGSNLAMEAGYKKFYLWLAYFYIDLPLWFHKEKKSGTVLSRINRGADSVFALLDSIAFGVLPRFISFFIALTVIFFIEWRLGLIVALTIGFYSLVTLKYTKTIIAEEKEKNRFWDKAYGDIYDSVGNIFAVKSFTNENFERKKHKANFYRMGASYKKTIEYWKRLSFWQDFVLGLGFIFVFAGGLWLLSLKEITVGKFVMFIGYFNLTTSPFVGLAFQYRFIRRSFVGIKKALKILKYKPEADYPHAKDIGKIQGKVVFQNISFKYKKGGEILKGVNFSVEPGEMAALVGESGVGKSTLASLISRYYLPNEGKIFIDGKEIRRVKFRSLREQTAVVPQEVALFNDTVKNNIAYGKIGASDEEIIAAAKAANADEFIEKFAKKYKQIVGERGVKLSTGQKQRIAIARAILRDPRILILDEATAALDSVSEKLVQDALQKLIKGRTVFVIAHRLSTIVHADKIIVLEGGKIVETGRHEDLIKQEGVYKKFWELQTRVEEAAPAHLLNGIMEER